MTAYAPFLRDCADTFGPIGPSIVTGLDPAKLHLVTCVIGEVREEPATDMLLYGVAEIVSFTSRTLTREPGDLIFTGTPATTAELRSGDTGEIEISGIDALPESSEGRWAGGFVDDRREA